MPGYNSPSRNTVRTLPKFLCCSQNFCVLCIVCFVSFCVLFVCKCILYNCHWVATQWQLTNVSSYHIACRMPDNFLRNRGWETLDLTAGWVAEESDFDLQQGQRHVSSPQHLNQLSPPPPFHSTPASSRGVKRPDVKLLLTFIRCRLVTSSWGDVWLRTRTTSNLIRAQHTTLYINCLIYPLGTRRTVSPWTIHTLPSFTASRLL
jgi:hypothetical protein